MNSLHTLIVAYGWIFPRKVEIMFSMSGKKSVKCFEKS